MINPRVTITLATYFPNEDFFRKQLKSLNEQTYNEIELIVCDDSDDATQFKKISKMLQKEITSFPFRVLKNEQNVGSNKTFERLTEETTSEFIAYADQDDVWNNDKIEKLVSLTRGDRVSLVYSDLRLIDSDDNVISESALRSSFRMQHVHGDVAFSYLIESNSVTGCAMLIRAEVAKSALPFPSVEYFVHDHWLAIAAASQGVIAYSGEPLICYRIHNNNQVGVKRSYDLDTVEKYVESKIVMPLKRLELIKSRMVLSEDKLAILSNKTRFNELRLDKYNRKKNNAKSKNISLNGMFESILFACPKFMQNVLLRFKNVLVKNTIKIINKLKIKNIK